MRRTITSLPLALVLAACGPEAQPAAPVSAAVPSAGSANAPAPARVTSCAARPGTVYGDEVVAFVLEGAGNAGATAEVEANDERGQSVFRAAVAVPGEVQVPNLGSGDFTLKVAQSSVTCRVTVNRELPRARPPEQK